MTQLIADYAFIAFLIGGMSQLWYAASILTLRLKGSYGYRAPSVFAITLQLFLGLNMLFVAYIMSLDGTFR